MREVEEKKQRMFKDKPGKMASVLGGYTLLWWGVYGVLKWSGWYVSRRMVSFFLFLLSFSDHVLTFTSLIGESTLCDLDRRFQHFITIGLSFDSYLDVKLRQEFDRTCHL